MSKEPPADSPSQLCTGSTPDPLTLSLSLSSPRDETVNRSPEIRHVIPGSRPARQSFLRIKPTSYIRGSSTTSTSTCSSHWLDDDAAYARRRRGDER